jgi:hypothetical protein
LLQQFLETNHDTFEYSVFGVSAQGGDVTVAEEKQMLLDLEDAVDRIKVRHQHCTHKDITKPLAWLLEGT